MQVQIMRALSVPLPITGTADVVRGHPALVGNQLRFAQYDGRSYLLLDDVELEASEVHRPMDQCFDDTEHTTTWYAQVCNNKPLICT